MPLVAISYSIKFEALPEQTCVGIAIVAEIGNSRAEVLSVSYWSTPNSPAHPKRNPGKWYAKKITLIRHATLNPAQSQEANSQTDFADWRGFLSFVSVRGCLCPENLRKIVGYMQIVWYRTETFFPLPSGI